MNSLDTVQRFYFDNTDLRGEIITLHKTLLDAMAHHHSSPTCRTLLGEFFAAAGLIAGILKFEGILTLQVRGDGPISLIMAEATHERCLRGIVNAQEGIEEADLAGKNLQTLVGDGVLTITLDPIEGQRYQGIIALEGATLADALSDYFAQSEQLPTRLWLEADTDRAAGLLLQALPPTGERKHNQELREEEFNGALQLANTLSREELLNLSHEDILYRLFNSYSLRLMPAVSTSFRCSCSKTRSGNALISLGMQDAYDLLAEQKIIGIDCQFCGQHYSFEQQDLDALFHVDAGTH
ncbi:MAG: Hsp33 family molecular chaperone HslO [Marinagarivorans sp.]